MAIIDLVRQGSDRGRAVVIGCCPGHCLLGPRLKPGFVPAPGFRAFAGTHPVGSPVLLSPPLNLRFDPADHQGGVPFSEAAP